jgi:hypothetical protein
MCPAGLLENPPGALTAMGAEGLLCSAMTCCAWCCEGLGTVYRVPKGLIDVGTGSSNSRDCFYTTTG